MKVEIVGGPRDGEVLEVRNGVYHITFPVEEPLRADWFEKGTAPTAESSYKTVALPIVRRVDGKFFIKWKKGM